jgi:hypothetical protein
VRQIGPSARRLARLVRTDIKAMPDIAAVLRPTATSSYGGYASNYAQVGTRVVTAEVQAALPGLQPGTTPGRLSASVLSGGNEQPGAGSRLSLMGYTLTVPPGTDIKPSDRIEAGGLTFEVISGKKAASWNLSDAWTLTEITR